MIVEVFDALVVVVGRMVEGVGEIAEVVVLIIEVVGSRIVGIELRIEAV